MNNPLETRILRLVKSPQVRSNANNIFDVVSMIIKDWVTLNTMNIFGSARALRFPFNTLLRCFTSSRHSKTALDDIALRGLGAFSFDQPSSRGDAAYLTITPQRMREVSSGASQPSQRHTFLLKANRDRHFGAQQSHTQIPHRHHDCRWVLRFDAQHSALDARDSRDRTPSHYLHVDGRGQQAHLEICRASSKTPPCRHFTHLEVRGHQHDPPILETTESDRACHCTDHEVTRAVRAVRCTSSHPTTHLLEWWLQLRDSIID